MQTLVSRQARTIIADLRAKEELSRSCVVEELIARMQVAGHPITPLRAWRLAAGLTLPQAAARITARTGIPVSPQCLSIYERDEEDGTGTSGGIRRRRRAEVRVLYLGFARLYRAGSVAALRGQRCAADTANQQVERPQPASAGRAA